MVILGISPGNVGFENAPFKLTKEYINIIRWNKFRTF